MLKRYLYAALLLQCTWHSTALADPESVAAGVDLVSLVVPALQYLDRSDLEDDWFYTMHVVEGDELRVIQSDPDRGKYERRQLISVNGVAPNEDRKKEFYESEVERVDGLDPEALGYSYMVDDQTLQLLEVDDEFAHFSFVPKVQALEGVGDQLRGALLLNLNAGLIDEIEITNSGQLSPAFSVTVDRYRLTLRFKQQQGENLLTRLESHAAGKAAFFKSFETLVEISFSDYKRAERAFGNNAQGTHRDNGAAPF